MSEIQPIDQAKQQAVIVEVQRYVSLAAEHYQQAFPAIDVVFNLRGRAAGMYKVVGRAKRFSTKLAVKQLLEKSLLGNQLLEKQFLEKQRQIRFNPWLFAKYEEDSWENTIPHEVAHYIADCRFGLGNIKPHGLEWQQIMGDFGAEPTVRASYNLDDIPMRRVQRFDYQCACRTVELTTYRHKKIQKGIQQYLCRQCSQPLVFSG